MLYSNRQKLIFIFIAVCCALIGLFGYRWYFRQDALNMQQQLAAQEGSQWAAFAAQVSRSGYDFNRLLKLVEKAVKIHKDFYDQFRGVRVKHKSFDVKKVKGLLSDLYREKMRLASYMWQERVKAQGVLSIKQKRTIQYYQRTIDQCINELEEVLRRI